MAWERADFSLVSVLVDRLKRRWTTDANISTTLDISGKSTSDLSEGSNLYYTDARFDTRLSSKNTANLSEGTNLYYTDARVQTVIDSNSAGFITPSSSSALTNKTGNISQWTNDSGYLTSESDSQTLSFSSPSISITGGNSINISALTTGLITARLLAPISFCFDII
mgnify:CR=1 FL=1